MLRSVYGLDVLKNVAVVFTDWPLDSASIENRRKAGVSQDQATQYVSEQLKYVLNFLTVPPSCSFRLFFLLRTEVFCDLMCSKLLMRAFSFLVEDVISFFLVFL